MSTVGEIRKLTAMPAGKKHYADVISRLREMLQMAEAGELDNVFIVGVGPDSSVSSCWGNDIQPFAMLGGIENAKSEFARFTIERREIALGLEEI